MPFVNKWKRPWRLSGLGLGFSKGFQRSRYVYSMYVLGAQNGSYLGTLGPKGVLYMYKDRVEVESRITDLLLHVGECISSVP